MNHIEQLTGFFNTVSNDKRLSPIHVSVYMALFQVWNINSFQNPISISRAEIMKLTKIGANATYHKVIKQLHDYGYIAYSPSFNPFTGSLVYLIDLTSKSNV